VIDVPGRLADGTVLWPSDHYGVLADVAIFAAAPRTAGHGGAQGAAAGGATVQATPGVLPAPSPRQAGPTGPHR